MTPTRRRLYALVTVLFPFVFLLLLEGGLRVLNYGPNLDLFLTETLNGTSYTIMNPGVKHRYFSRVTFIPSTSPDYFLDPKPAGTFRIFCLGGSTTVGFPYWYNGAFSSFLRDRLSRMFPDRSIEVINVGMTATNSYTVVDMLRDLFSYEPDLIIVYDGHNEFYGALGVASHESVGGSHALSRLALRLVHIRLFQAMRDGYALAGRLFGSDDDAPARGTMMERLARGRYIPHGSDLYREGLEAFRDNLATVQSLCREHGIPVLFGTQVSNLRGLAPFISTDVTSLPTDEQLAFHRTFNNGLTALMNSSYDSAVTAFTAATRMLPHHAESHYRLALALDKLGRHPEARAAYVRARDEDELRFRTSSDFNDAIRAMDDGGLTGCADVEQEFARLSPQGIIGTELVLEHLHPSSYGQFLIARAYARVMRARGILVPAAEWAARDTLNEEQLWNMRHLTELDERLAQRRTEVLVTAWPFSQEELPVSAIAADDTLGQIADLATRGQIHWREAHDRAIEYYRNQRNAAGLEREYRTIINQLPAVDVQPYLQLAHLLLSQQRYTEVESVLRRSLNVKATILAYRAIADICLQSGRPAEAAEFYKKTFAFTQSLPEQVDNGYLLALALYRSGRSDLALQRIDQVLRLRPDHMASIQLMARINTPPAP